MLRTILRRRATLVRRLPPVFDLRTVRLRTFVCARLTDIGEIIRMRHARSRSHTNSTTVVVRGRRSRRGPAPRRRGIARLRSAYFAHAGELAARYGVTFDRVIAHLWQSRHRHPRFFLRAVMCLDDLVQALACLDGCGLAWSDLQERHERTLVRRCREGRDETETTVIVRRFIAELRRTALNGRCTMLEYLGTRPLRNWLADELNAHLLRRHRAAFTIDPADTACPTLQFTPFSGTGW